MISKKLWVKVHLHCQMAVAEVVSQVCAKTVAPNSNTVITMPVALAWLMYAPTLPKQQRVISTQAAKSHWPNHRPCTANVIRPMSTARLNQLMTSSCQ